MGGLQRQLLKREFGEAPSYWASLPLRHLVRPQQTLGCVLTRLESNVFLCAPRGPVCRQGAHGGPATLELRGHFSFGPPNKPSK